jgi:hypothetical protein
VLTAGGHHAPPTPKWVPVGPPREVPGCVSEARPLVRSCFAQGGSNHNARLPLAFPRPLCFVVLCFRVSCVVSCRMSCPSTAPLEQAVEEGRPASTAAAGLGSAVGPKYDDVSYTRYPQQHVILYQCMKHTETGCAGWHELASAKPLPFHCCSAAAAAASCRQGPVAGAAGHGHMVGPSPRADMSHGHNREVLSRLWGGVRLVSGRQSAPEH